jgi:hypothetical protein
MRKQFFSLAVLIIFSVSSARSQEYTTAVGLKFYPGAFSFKHFVTSNSAIEGMASFWNYGSRFTALYEIHNSISGANGLSWYYGPGVHLSLFKSKYGGISPGIDGVLGLDYKFQNAPLNISIDWQPSIELGDYDNDMFIGGWGGLAIRYTF